MREPPPRVPDCIPSREPQHLYGAVEPDDHSRLETPCTPSHLQGASTFREPYPVTNLPTTCTCPLPRSLLASGDSQLAAATHVLTQARRSICAPSGRRPRPPVMLHRPLIASFRLPPSSDRCNTPVWPAAQSGPPPPMPLMQPAPSAPFPVPPVLVAPFGGPASSTTSARQLRPRRLGPMPSYYPAPTHHTQPATLGPWPSYQQH